MRIAQQLCDDDYEQDDKDCVQQDESESQFSKDSSIHSSKSDTHWVSKYPSTGDMKLNAKVYTDGG